MRKRTFGAMMELSVIKFSIHDSGSGYSPVCIIGVISIIPSICSAFLYKALANTVGPVPYVVPSQAVLEPLNSGSGPLGLTCVSTYTVPALVSSC